MLTPLSALASKQASPTELTIKKCLQFLDYAATQDNAILPYKASNMILAIHSNASYLSEPKAQSQASGHMFMAGYDKIPINNGAILNISQVKKSVMSSAAEAELAALFINAKTAVSMCTTLKELGNPQTQTPMQTDNSTAQHMHYSPKKSSQRLSKPWTCNSTGSSAVKPKDNLGITGDQAHKTLLITGQSTTQQATTQHSAHEFRCHLLTLNTQNS
jgi:hypothetical protein